MLPLSITGAVAMSHSSLAGGEATFSSGEDWFIYKYDRQSAGLAGLAFDEGTFSVLGYVTRGMDLVEKLDTGDRLVSATVVAGADKLVRTGAAG